MKRSLLVLVLLSPWLAAVWVGLHNLRQPRQLQLLTGTTPALPIGVWLLLSSSLGMTLGGAAGVLLQMGSAPSRRREEDSHHDGAGDEDMEDESNPDPGPWRGTESCLGEPAPIVDVPFRVVRPGRTPGPDPGGSPSPAHNDSADNNDDWQPPQAETW